MSQLGRVSLAANKAKKGERINGGCGRDQGSIRNSAGDLLPFLWIGICTIHDESSWVVEVSPVMSTDSFWGHARTRLLFLRHSVGRNQNLFIIGHTHIIRPRRTVLRSTNWMNILRLPLVNSISFKKKESGRYLRAQLIPFLNYLDLFHAPLRVG